jgi:pimeloyl-ACP methyl ester carboxylesterase
MVPGSPRVMAKLFSPRRYHEKTYMKDSAGELYGGRFRSDPELATSHASRVRWPSTLGYSLQLLATAGWTSLPWLWRLRQTTLVIYGADDPICPPINWRILARCIPHARLEIIDDGHLFLVARPEESARIVRRFLA